MQPKATEYVSEMISIISKLIANNAAYISHNHVYFSVHKAKDYYTKLSGRKIEELMAQQEDGIGKKDNGDFVLWKPAKKMEEETDVFDSPWGKGRPGWHIECSAMSHKLLGANFDIHGGGVDLIFPHHTNEIAQNKEAFTGSNHANFWVHSGFLTINKEKMSKSLGNFITVRNLQDNKISSEAFRLFILNTHYRKPIDFTEKSLNDSENKLNYMYQALNYANYTTHCEYNEEQVAQCILPNEFKAFLLDDMNIHGALQYLYELAKDINKNCTDKKEKAQMLANSANFLGLLINKSFKQLESSLNITEVKTIEDLIAQRQVAKNNNDWQLADKIRSNLEKLGITLQDHKDNSTTWRKKS